MLINGIDFSTLGGLYAGLYIFFRDYFLMLFICWVKLYRFSSNSILSAQMGDSVFILNFLLRKDNCEILIEIFLQFRHVTLRSVMFHKGESFNNIFQIFQSTSRGTTIHTCHIVKHDHSFYFFVAT